MTDQTAVLDDMLKNNLEAHALLDLINGQLKTRDVFLDLGLVKRVRACVERRKEIAAKIDRADRAQRRR